MSTTVNVYPTTTAHQYWSNTNWTSFSPYTRSLAGVTANTYRWPIPFDLSAYASKSLVTLKLNVKFSSASNTFSGAERLDVGVRATNNSAADAAAATYLDQLLPVDEQWCVFDVELAWDTLKAGTGYLVLSSDEEYAVLYNNYGTVSVNDRPYLALTYNENLQVWTGTEWKQATKVQVYDGATWKEATGIQVYDGATWKTAY